MSELMLSLEQIEKEKGISKEVIIDSIEKGITDAYNKYYGKNENASVHMNRETGEMEVFANKTVVDEVNDDAVEISLEKARMISSKYDIGDIVPVPVTPKDFGRIAAQHARSIIIQKIKEEEKRLLYEYFYSKEKDIVTGVVQRYVGNNISINLDDKMDVLLMESEQVKTEHYRPKDRIKLYVVGVKQAVNENQESNEKDGKKKNKGAKGPKVIVSRTHKDLVKRLLEKEVTEIADGIVEIKSISREPGSRSKIAVWSNDPNVDALGACVGKNGNRVNNIVDDLFGEKIDIINWDENPAIYIENALSPSEVLSVRVNEEEKSAKVVVPDDKLSLAIGKEGQNARLAARLTGYKIDIKSESQAREAYGYGEDDYDYDDYAEDDYRDDYDEDGYRDDYDDEYRDDYSDEEYEDDYRDDYDDEQYDDNADSSDQQESKD